MSDNLLAEERCAGWRISQNCAKFQFGCNNAILDLDVTAEVDFNHFIPSANRLQQNVKF